MKKLLEKIRKNVLTKRVAVHLPYYTHNLLKIYQDEKYIEIEHFLEATTEYYLHCIKKEYVPDISMYNTSPFNVRLSYLSIFKLWLLSLAKNRTLSEFINEAIFHGILVILDNKYDYSKASRKRHKRKFRDKWRSIYG